MISPPGDLPNDVIEARAEPAAGYNRSPHVVRLEEQGRPRASPYEASTDSLVCSVSDDIAQDAVLAADNVPVLDGRPGDVTHCAATVFYPFVRVGVSIPEVWHPIEQNLIDSELICFYRVLDDLIFACEVLLGPGKGLAGVCSAEGFARFWVTQALGLALFRSKSFAGGSSF